MNDWFRSWHGAPTDNKWLLIARKAGVAPGVVSAVVWALLDHASQAGERGSVAGFDVETYAVFSGFDEAQIQAVIDALKDKDIIGPDGGFKNWGKRQPKREDGAAERSKEWRERKRNENERDRTQANASERQIREETDTEKNKGKELSADADEPAQKSSRGGKVIARPEYPGDYEMLWAEFPRNPNSSKLEGFRSWSRLSQSDREACFDGAIAYAGWLSKQQRPPPPLHLATFINQRRFDGFLDLEAAQ